METRYCLIKKSDFTVAMLNRSLYESMDQIPVHVSTTNLLWLFPIDTEYYIVEFDVEQTKVVTYFDPYVWYTLPQIREIIDSE